MDRFVIVGNGLAGHTAAIHLSRIAPRSSVTLIGSEPGLPYDRPPLTKAFLLGIVAEEDLVFREATQYRDLDIDYRPSTQVTAIDRRASRILLSGGTELGYDKLMLATGSRPRELPNAISNGLVRYVRTIVDAALLRRELTPGRHIVVIGGGFIGLEVASSAMTLGCRVTLVEAAGRLLSRCMPPFVASFMQQLHEANGARVLLGETVQGITADRHGQRLVELSDRTIGADIVVAGIGVVPNVELAESAGLAVDDGIVVDAHCRTSDPTIFAAGEVTAHPANADGRRHRIESWQVAAKQPVIAAASMAGDLQSFDEPPWLWSDQYDVNIQAIGMPCGGSSLLFRGDSKQKRWTLLSVDDDGLPVGAVAVNNGRDISMMRRSLRLGQPLPDALKIEFGPLPTLAPTPSA